VIFGHVDSTSGPAVFYRLGELRPGETVRVLRKDGRTAVFQIDSVDKVTKDHFPTQKVYGDLPYAGIRLVTCGGRFDQATGHYVDKHRRLRPPRPNQSVTGDLRPNIIGVLSAN
jgi:sortase (surface protein transpeptidase)